MSAFSISQHGNFKHGLCNTTEYRSWAQMCSRCTSPSSDKWYRYGGIGITVCDRWCGKDGFLNFLEDMGKKPHPEYSIDRIDNSGNYEPGNCRWADRITQMNNRRDTTNYTIGSTTMTIAQWARSLDDSVHKNTMYARIKKGWNPKAAILTPSSQSDSPTLPTPFPTAPLLFKKKEQK